MLRGCWTKTYLTLNKTVLKLVQFSEMKAQEVLLLHRNWDFLKKKDVPYKHFPSKKKEKIFRFFFELVCVVIQIQTHSPREKELFPENHIFPLTQFTTELKFPF